MRQEEEEEVSKRNKLGDFLKTKNFPLSNLNFTKTFEPKKNICISYLLEKLF